MRQSRQIRLYSLLLAVVIAVVSTIMLLGIQINFNQSEQSAKIGAPIICIVLVAVLFVYKFISKQKKSNLIAKIKEKKGKKMSPYMTIFFTYFDYMLFCGIFSCVFAIAKGILNTLYQKMQFNWITSWGYTTGRLSIIFLIYIGCLLIYTIGLMVAYSVENRSGANEEL